MRYTKIKRNDKLLLRIGGSGWWEESYDDEILEFIDNLDIKGSNKQILKISFNNDGSDEFVERLKDILYNCQDRFYDIVYKECEDSYYDELEVYEVYE